MIPRLSLLLFAAAGLSLAEGPGTYVLQNARIVRVSGPAIQRGTVVVHDGLIEAVGESVPTPAGAWVIDAQGLTVYPGLIDALSTWGIPPAAAAQTASRGSSAPATPVAPGRRATAAATEPVAHGPEERPATNSWVRAADLLSPADSRIVSGRSAGFTSAFTFPTSGIFGGQGALINLSGEKRTMV